MGFFDFLFGKKNDKPTAFTEETVEERTETKEVKTPKTDAYLLLFSADWCGHSVIFKKEMDESGQSYTLIDADTYCELNDKYKIRNIPTTLLINKEGDIIEKWVGRDDEDPGQKKIVNFVSDYNILPYPVAEKEEEARIENQKKEEKERQEKEAREAQEKKEKEEQERLAELKRKKEQEEREKSSTLTPFVFKSTCHQRYENNVPKMGLQKCVRTVTVEKNTSGCPGYKLQPGIGYIVKIYNNDLNKPNMSDKPMKVVQKTGNMVELRGYPIEAQTPFGWQEVDYSDYGLIVYYQQGKVSKCVLNMYDRNIRIEYGLVLEKPAVYSPGINLTETEKYVNTALQQLSLGNDGDDVYHPLYLAWRSFQSDPSQLRNIQNYKNYGMGLMIFLSYQTVTDIDDQQQLASISYLFLGKALQKTPSDINLYKNRLIMMISNREAFEYTVSSVVNKDRDFLSITTMSPFTSRDALFKMEYADFSQDLRLLSIDMLRSKYVDLNDKVISGFFGNNETRDSIIATGKEHHKDILAYLENKVLTEGDIDF